MLHSIDETVRSESLRTESLVTSASTDRRQIEKNSDAIEKLQQNFIDKPRFGLNDANELEHRLMNEINRRLDPRYNDDF